MFRFDYRPSCERELAREPQLGAHIGRLVQKAAQSAKSSAPSGPTGRYRSSIRSVPSRMTGDGFAGAFGSDDFAWHLVEFGSAHNHPYRVLERAARTAGLRFEDSR
jgi:hypothetical protein